MSNKIHWGINLPVSNLIHWEINLLVSNKYSGALVWLWRTNTPVSIKPINLKIIYISLTNIFKTMVTKTNFKRKINDKKVTRRFDDSMSSLSNAKKN